MAAPSITAISPASGPASGGDLVRLTGLDFGPGVAVTIGGHCSVVAMRREADGRFVVDVHTPSHAEAVVDVELQNLDAAGQPVSGEQARLAAAYRFLRPRLVHEPDLTRLVRTLLRELKQQVIGNVSLTTSSEYVENGSVQLAVALAELPALVVTGPVLRENRVYATNLSVVEPAQTPGGPEFRRRRPSYTTDLEFRLTGSSNSTVELLGLTAAMMTFFNSNRWIQMPRDPARPNAGLVRWELDPVGEVRTSLDGPDDLRAFTCGLVIRGFDVAEGQVVRALTAAEEPQLTAEPFTPGGTT